MAGSAPVEQARIDDTPGDQHPGTIAKRQHEVQDAAGLKTLTGLNAHPAQADLPDVDRKIGGNQLAVHAAHQLHARRTTTFRTLTHDCCACLTMLCGSCLGPPKDAG